MREKETVLEGLQAGMERSVAKFEDLMMSFQTLFDSAKEDIKTLNEADSELMKLAADIKEAKMQKDH
ncbi:hypothetical protein LINPERHAP1_LOCUS13170, partial [Linum perenne]